MDIIMGQRIKQLREDADMPQKELARLLNIEGSTLSQYESGKRTPSDSVKIKICDIFDVSLDYLIGRKLYKISKGVTEDIELEELFTLNNIYVDGVRLGKAEKLGIIGLARTLMTILNEHKK